MNFTARASIEGVKILREQPGVVSRKRGNFPAARGTIGVPSPALSTLPRDTGVDSVVISLPRSAAPVRLLATVIAPSTAQLGEVTQPSAIRPGWRVTVPDFLLRALTRARPGASGGPQTAADTATQASYVILAITRRYARLAIVFARCTVVPCIKMSRAETVTLGIHIYVYIHI